MWASARSTVLEFSICMLFDNQRQTQGIINSKCHSLNVLGIWWLSLLVHIQCSSTSMGPSPAPSYHVTASLVSVRSRFYFQKNSKTWRQGWSGCSPFEKTNDRSSKRELKKVKKHNDNLCLCSKSYLCRCIWSEMHGACCLGVGGGRFWKEPPCGVLGAPWLSQDPRSPSIWTRHSARAMFHLSLA